MTTRRAARAASAYRQWRGARRADTASSRPAATPSTARRTFRRSRGATPTRHVPHAHTTRPLPCGLRRAAPAMRAYVRVQVSTRVPCVRAQACTCARACVRYNLVSAHVIK